MSARFVLCCFLFRATSFSQRPEAPGQLTVTSVPANQPITIDGTPTKVFTPFTFTVSPGNHSVSLESVPPCKKSQTVSISSNSATSIMCDANGWGKPTQGNKKLL
jgi:hypothetical protein